MSKGLDYIVVCPTNILICTNTMHFRDDEGMGQNSLFRSAGAFSMVWGQSLEFLSSSGGGRGLLGWKWRWLSGLGEPFPKQREELWAEDRTCMSPSVRRQDKQILSLRCNSQRRGGDTWVFVSRTGSPVWKTLGSHLWMTGLTLEIQPLFLENIPVHSILNYYYSTRLL